MQDDFRNLRLQQLDRILAPFLAAQKVPRPPKGWIRAIREALGLSSAELARRLGASRQLPLQQEKAEAEDRITLKGLKSLANALDCDLVYALVPRAESLQALVDSQARREAQRRVLGVEHSMALEDQAVGDLEQAVDAETYRILGSHSPR